MTRGDKQKAKRAGGAHDHEGHGHSHGGLRGLDEIRTRGTRAIKFALIVTLAFMAIQLIGGIIANSLALLADAVHMGTDAAAFVLSLFAFWMSRRPATSKMSYGYYRAEILGALLSSAALWVVSVFLIYEAIRRMAAPPEVRGGLVFIIALITLVMNLITMRILHGTQKESLNVRAAYLHVISDLLGNIGVLIAGAIIYFTGWYIADPILTILFMGLILWSTTKMVWEAVEILMEASPRKIDPDAVRQSLEALPTVVGVHDLHIWTVSSGRLAMSVHLLSRDEKRVLSEAHHMIADEYKISHMTIQIEDPDHFEKGYCYDCEPPASRL